MHNRHITWHFGAELQPVCQEQDVELSSIVLELSSHDVWNLRPQKTVFLFLLDHCRFGMFWAHV